MSLPTPTWLSKVPEHRRKAELVRHRVRVAALLTTREGTLSALSAKLGLTQQVLSSYCSPASGKRVPPKVAHNIERLTQGVIQASDLTDGML